MLRFCEPRVRKARFYRIFSLFTVLGVVTNSLLLSFE
nr:MAG TPA: hypothetical protein [Caudoviricetes sp.]